MPASPIAKKNIEIPDNWVHLQKTMIPDQATASYWSVWFDPPTNMIRGGRKVLNEGWLDGTAWLMWCPIDEDPSVNDSWGHAEEIDESCRNVLDTIKAVYGVSFHEYIWVEMGAGKVFPARQEV